MTKEAKDDMTVKISRCRMIAIETNIHQSTNNVDVSNYTVHFTIFNKHNEIRDP